MKIPNGPHYWKKMNVDPLEYSFQLVGLEKELKDVNPRKKDLPCLFLNLLESHKLMVYKNYVMVPY